MVPRPAVPHPPARHQCLLHQYLLHQCWPSWMFQAGRCAQKLTRRQWQEWQLVKPAALQSQHLQSLPQWLHRLQFLLKRNRRRRSHMYSLSVICSYKRLFRSLDWKKIKTNLNHDDIEQVRLQRATSRTAHACLAKWSFSCYYFILWVCNVLVIKKISRNISYIISDPWLTKQGSVGQSRPIADTCCLKRWLAI